QVPAALDKVAPSVPRMLAAAVARALAKNPAERFADCSAFAQAVLSTLVPRDDRGEAPPGTLVGTPVITCPRAKKLYRLRVEMLGRVVRCKRCDTSFQVPGKRPRERSEKSKAETKGNPQARVETPRATPTTHNAEAPGPRRRSCAVMLMGLLTLVLL